MAMRRDEFRGGTPRGVRHEGVQYIDVVQCIRGSARKSDRSAD
jgi:hypothetical protein